MTEVFRVRENMSLNYNREWCCQDENGNIICEGGPSIIWGDGNWSFWISGIGLHRLEGPATSFGDWYIFGKRVTNKIYAFAKENDIDLENLTDEDKVMIALRFG